MGDIYTKFGAYMAWERERGLLHSDEVLTIKWKNKSSLAQNKMIKGQKYKLN